MPDGKKRAYTSILSVMQVMERKGLLTHTSKGAAHVYQPAVNRRDILQPFMRRLLTEVFGGRPAALMQALLSETSVSDADLAEMRKLPGPAKTAKEGQPTERKGGLKWNVSSPCWKANRCTKLLLALAHTLWQGALAAGVLFLYLEAFPAEAARQTLYRRRSSPSARSCSGPC